MTRLAALAALLALAALAAGASITLGQSAAPSVTSLAISSDPGGDDTKAVWVRAAESAKPND